jgi:hypothetical protein
MSTRKSNIHIKTKKMTKTMRQYKKKLVKYAMAIVLFSFIIGIPIALWTANKISGDKVEEKGTKAIKAGSIVKITKFIHKRE